VKKHEDDVDFVNTHARCAINRAGTVQAGIYVFLHDPVAVRLVFLLTERWRETEGDIK
jgi:hypothetical protein